MRGRRKYEKMNIINVENITKSYTGRKLFSKASFYVQENEKIGIIGIKVQEVYTFKDCGW
mgnify:CR=1 FL=1